MREEKNEKNTQFGHLYTFTDYHKHLLFCALPLSIATGSTTKRPAGWSTTTLKYPIIPSNCDPLYNMSFTSNLTGFPVKVCGNYNGGVGNDGGGVPNVGIYTIS